MALLFTAQEINKIQSYFIPDYLMQDTESTGFASRPEVLFDEITFEGAGSDLTSPMMILWLLLFILVAQLF